MAILYMKAPAIIPARGGSRGIPRKNVRLLAGKPMLAYTIKNALQARGVDRVAVSTDESLKWLGNPRAPFFVLLKNFPENMTRQEPQVVQVVERPLEIHEERIPWERRLIKVVNELFSGELYIFQIRCRRRPEPLLDPLHGREPQRAGQGRPPKDSDR